MVVLITLMIYHDHVFESYVDHQGYPIWREIDYDVIFHLLL